MHRLVYSSRSTGPFDRAELAQILATSRRRNADEGVTGLLLYSDRTFLQLLEGEEPAVRAAYARISADSRHDEVTLLVDRPVDERECPDWAMGFHHLDGFLVDAVAVTDPDRAEDLLRRHRVSVTT